jgi:hypothetical protein
LFENNFSSNSVIIGFTIVIIGVIIKTNIIAVARDGKPAIKGIISESITKARGDTNMVVVNTCLEKLDKVSNIIYRPLKLKLKQQIQYRIVPH